MGAGHGQAQAAGAFRDRGGADRWGVVTGFGQLGGEGQGGGFAADDQRDDR